VLFGSYGDVGEFLEAGNERAAEAAEAVSVGVNGRVLDAVEVLTHLFGGVNPVVQVRDKGRNGSLEVDVVLPEGIVCVDEEGLGRCVADGLILGGHGLIIRLEICKGGLVEDDTVVGWLVGRGACQMDRSIVPWRCQPVPWGRRAVAVDCRVLERVRRNAAHRCRRRV
jgi:hypothetical protein